MQILPPLTAPPPRRMHLAQLLPALHPVRVLGPVDRPVRAVTHDSRAAGPDDVFVAIIGAINDARRFVPGLNVAAVVCETPVEAEPGVTVIQVENARLALAQAAAELAGHPARDMNVIGLTGTNGKTTTSYLLESIAAAAGLRSGVIGTTGHRVGNRPLPAVHTTPEAPVLQHLLCQMRDEGCELVAMEVSSIGLSMHRVDSIPFKAGVFTNFTQDHLDFHGSMDNYLSAKQRLFHELIAPDGTAILLADDPTVAGTQTGDRKTWTFGRQEGADIRAVNVRCTIEGTTAEVHTPMGTGALQVQLIGTHNLENALAALASGLALGLPLKSCLSGVAQLTRVPGRLESVANQTGITVLVDYAHTPDALSQVLAALRPLTRGRLRTVFGCGGDRDQAKRTLMGQEALAGSDISYVTSDNPRSEDPLAIIEEILSGMQHNHADTSYASRVKVIPDRAAAIEKAIQESGPGDVVLVAGKGHEQTQTIGDQVIPFDDRAVAASILRALEGKA